MHNCHNLCHNGLGQGSCWVAKYFNARALGHIFVFKYEEDSPELLHIYARHQMEPEDAIEIFFEGTVASNTERRRFESNYQGRTMTWFWLDETMKVVMVISC